MPPEEKLSDRGNGCVFNHSNRAALVLLFYFLLSGPSMARGLLKLMPPLQRPLIMHIWTVLDPVLKRYFIGVLVVVAYAAAAAYVGLGLVLGIPHAVLALLTGVVEMIPVIGPGAAAVMDWWRSTAPQASGPSSLMRSMPPLCAFPSISCSDR